jgi:tetratricopeptide (TPR) repeat protein
MVLGRQTWQPGPLRCCGCERVLEAVHGPDTVSAGAGIVPQLPGAVCARCLPVTAGPVVADLKALAAAQMLQSLAFELRTDAAVQFFLDLFGWQRDVAASGALRLHADGKPGRAYDLLKAAASSGQAAFFQVERAALLLLDGETGQAHELLLATGPQDHPCWHLHRGTLAYSVGRPEAALEHWRLQIASRPDQPLGWQTLGFYLLHEAGDLPAAVSHFAEAAAAFPDQPEFRAWLAEAEARLARERTT